MDLVGGGVEVRGQRFEGFCVMEELFIFGAGVRDELEQADDVGEFGGQGRRGCVQASISKPIAMARAAAAGMAMETAGRRRSSSRK